MPALLQEPLMKRPQVTQADTKTVFPGYLIQHDSALPHQQRIVSYVTTTPRSSNNSSMSRRLRLNRKYQRTAQLMTPAGKRWP
jgi:hypothetical protein